MDYAYRSLLSEDFQPDKRTISFQIIRDLFISNFAGSKYENNVHITLFAQDDKT